MSHPAGGRGAGAAVNPVPNPQFEAAHAVLRAEIRLERLAGVSAALMRDGVLIDSFCAGLADREAGTPLRSDSIHRAFSNTKLFTSVLVLMLHDEGRFGLDDPVAEYLPELGALRVLRPGATRLDDTEALARPVTIRHLLTHQAGFSHGVFAPGTPLHEAYHASGARSPHTSLAELMPLLAGLPLQFQPGEGWDYALGCDVLARLAERLCGQAFGDLLQQRLFGPLGLRDTGFVLRPEQVPRLAALYAGDPAHVLASGLRRLHDTPWPQAYLQPVARQSGAGGLFSTQADMLALLQALLPAHPAALLRPATLAALYTDQLPPGRCVRFANQGAIAALGFGLAGAVSRTASPLVPAAAVGELQWGGLAGTHWFIHPGRRLLGVLMTQRMMGFWNPFWFLYRQRVYEALG
ncbi:serine hydrolase domain-containing protein [Aquabacterium sp. OR-4]|uniref:serine hydrolase domain-containing protein n=1 Tax=Aquabacterium sp. OR-4 TaxID=2978127 RepID=UPI0021B255A3|nr:serine hydrolase domain-containing protein [Aquabacterium sp. OR-4]MDT7837716.1 serine hydrolase domain-containing protein [Aquabacterium sp. OR-4]